MHFYYLDEAGCTGSDLTNREQPIFVLGGISVRDEGWNTTQEAMSKIIDEYFEKATPKNFELHAEQLLSPHGNGPFSNHDRNRRNDLAKKILGLLAERKHDVHLFAIDKEKLNTCNFPLDMSYNTKTPYLLAYDYLITYINCFVKEHLGISARAMLIIDVKDQFHADIEHITQERRFEGPEAHRVKLIVEFSYPVDSKKNPMVQISDLIVYCAKKFLEIDNGYRNNYSQDAKRFYAECYAMIDSRVRKKGLVKRQGRGMDTMNNYLLEIQSKPSHNWKRKYKVD